MRMPAEILTQPTDDGRSLLHHVFGALLSAGSESPQPRNGNAMFETPTKTRAPPSPPETSTPIRRDSRNVFGDFDPTIHLDNTKEGTHTQRRHYHLIPTKQALVLNDLNTVF